MVSLSFALRKFGARSVVYLSNQSRTALYLKGYRAAKMPMRSVTRTTDIALGCSEPDRDDHIPPAATYRSGSRLVFYRCGEINNDLLSCSHGL